MMVRRFAAVGAIALFLFLGLLCLANQSSADVRATDLCVDNYPSIQAAIDGAGEGVVVRVPVGVYTETLAITKTLTLQGGWDAGCANRVTSDPAQTVIDANQAGTVISITEGSPVIENLTVTGGWAREGGGVYIFGALPTLRRLIITGNTISSTVNDRTRGAGIYIRSDSLTLDHCDVLSNTAYSHPDSICVGAGLHIHSASGDIYFIATRIMHNGPAGGADVRGGGIGLYNGQRLHFVGSENLIAHNEAYYGGGIKTRGHITGATIISNTATLGGGIMLDGSHDGVVANSVIVGNRATSEGSGLYMSRGGQAINNTIVANVDGKAGVVVGTGISAMTLTNNVIVGHETGIHNRNNVSPTLVTNDLWDNDLNYKGVTTGTTDVHVAPQFVDTTAGDYHLADDSPLIDAGTIVPEVTTDFDGDPRPIGVSHDIGADEWGRFIFMPLVLRAGL